MLALDQFTCTALPFYLELINRFAAKIQRVINVELFNPNGAGGHIMLALFSDRYFFMKKGVWRSEIS